jgi:hypothetical protein
MNCKWVTVSLATLSALSSALISSVPETSVSEQGSSLETVLAAPSLVPDKPINCCGRSVPGSNL